MSGPTGRLLSLLSLLQVHRDWPGPVLAGRLEVSERTVRRDVDRLRELGYRVAALKGPDGGYRLDAGNDLPPLLFDDEQAVALAVGLRLAAGSGVGVDDAAARALATVQQVLPSRLRHRVDGLRVVPLPQASPVRVDPEVLIHVSAAVRAREVLRFDYGPPAEPDDGPRAPRRTEPHEVVTRGGRWYLLGWDLDRDDWRTYRLDRLAPRTPDGPRFTPRPVPGGDAARFVSARFKGSAVADAWPCTGQVLVDRPAHEVAPYVGEGTVEARGEDRCLVVLGSWSWVGLAARLGGLEADVEVVGPPQLREAFAVLAGRYAGAAG